MRPVIYTLRWLRALLSSRRCSWCEVCTGLAIPGCTGCTANRAHLHCSVCDHSTKYHEGAL